MYITAPLGDRGVANGRVQSSPSHPQKQSHWARKLPEATTKPLPLHTTSPVPFHDECARKIFFKVEAETNKGGEGGGLAPPVDFPRENFGGANARAGPKLQMLPRSPQTPLCSKRSPGRILKLQRQRGSRRHIGGREGAGAGDAAAAPRWGEACVAGGEGLDSRMNSKMSRCRAAIQSNERQHHRKKEHHASSAAVFASAAAAAAAAAAHKPPQRPLALRRVTHTTSITHTHFVGRVITCPHHARKKSVTVTCDSTQASFTWQPELHIHYICKSVQNICRGPPLKRQELHAIIISSRLSLCFACWPWWSLLFQKVSAQQVP